MEEKMDIILNSMVTKKDMDEFTNVLENRLGKIEGKQADQAKSQVELHVRLKKLENERQPLRAFRKLDRDRPGGKESQKSINEMAFLEARKSLILSPVSADVESVRKFLDKQMIIDNEAVEDLKIISVNRIHSKQLKDRSLSKGDLTRVIFGSVYERDLVMSHASNLPRDCSLEIVIPDHLLSLKKVFENFAYKVRKYA